MYEYYDNDKLLIEFGHNSFLELIKSGSFDYGNNTGNPIPLDGDYKWKNSDSTLIIEFLLKNGHFLWIKEFHFARSPLNPSELIWIHYDKMYNNMRGTHLDEIFKFYNGGDFSLKKSQYYYKKNGHWRYHKIKGELK